MRKKILHWSPRILALLFVGFLCLFSFDSFNEINGWRSVFDAVMHLAIPAIVLFATILAWKRDLVGALCFFGFAICYVFMVGLNRHWSWYALISGPAMLTAVLFFISWLNKKQSEHVF
jgi:ribose/xylose/arabinose/galactoside ABC-type transport system permease subunit